VRLPAEQARQPRLPHRSRRVFILVAVIVILVGLLSLQGFANFYTDYLWYSSEHLNFVWRSIVETKLSLAGVFVAAMFVALWSSLWFVDRMAPRLALFAPELELVRRYQTVVGPHVFAVRTTVSALVAFAVGEGAAGEWQNWILFEHSEPFGYTDPIFHRDASFFVFRLPFLSFVVNWMLLALLVIFVVTVISHYLNGSIRLQGAGPRVDPIAVAHLSLVLGLAALVKAIGYYYVQRFTLEYSSRGVVAGANYTDVHVGLPAITLLAVIALFAFALLVYNIYQRSIVLPAIALGLWAVVGLAIGVIYPALVQAFKVNPSQSTLELPYISDNIKATQFAYGIQPSGTQNNAGTVGTTSFSASDSVTASEAEQYKKTLNDAVLWDPNVTSSTFQKLQSERSYFQLTGLSVVRYTVNTDETPFVVGVRTLDTAGVPSPSWVNTHLQYTHGDGVVVSPANTATSGGNPSFTVSGIPPSVTPGAPDASQLLPQSSQVYFGAQSSDYVVVDTGQAEIDYTQPNSNKVITSHFQPPSGTTGTGAVPMGGFWTRAAFALRFHDINLLISKLVTPSSRIIFVQDVRQMVEKAAPFLQVDANPYPVVSAGVLYWIVDAYTETSYFPYSQPADTSALSGASGLQGSYNYVRNSVKVAINAYTGQMQFFAVDPAADPLIQAYMAAFPGLFTDLSALANTDPDLLTQLRYPQDLLELQATMFGRYHVPYTGAGPASFYNQANAWEVAQSPGSGSPSAALPAGPNGGVARFQPVYEELQLDGSTSQQFELVEPMVPFSQGDRLQTLSGFLVADCEYTTKGPQTYGQLTMYTTPQGVPGPGLINSEINANSSVASAITLLDQHGSVVITGSVQLLPIDGGIVYVRPIYGSSSQNQFPELRDVVLVYGNTVVLQPTLGLAEQALFGALAGVGVNQFGLPSGVLTQNIRDVIAEADKYAAIAEKDLALSPPDLGGYEAAEQQVAFYVKEADEDFNAQKKQKPSSSTSSTSTTLPAGATGTTGTPPSGATGTGGAGATGTTGAGSTSTSTSTSTPTSTTAGTKSSQTTTSLGST
jgi:uncharacterized membrane protein (UPF0182 family)